MNNFSGFVFIFGYNIDKSITEVHQFSTRENSWKVLMTSLANVPNVKNIAFVTKSFVEQSNYFYYFHFL